MELKTNESEFIDIARRTVPCSERDLALMRLA